MEARLAARRKAREEKDAMRAAERAAEEERKKNEGPFSAMRRQIRARMMAVTLVQQQYLTAAAKAEAGDDQPSSLSSTRLVHSLVTF